MSDNLAPTEGTPLPDVEQPPLAELQVQSGGAPEPQATEPQDASAAKTSMNQMLSEEYSYSRPKRGEIREGRVMAIRPDGIVVDLGLKREGLIPADDLRQIGSDAVDTLKEGDEIPVYVLRPENDKEGNVLVSWHRARQEQDWFDAQDLHDTAKIWEGTIKGYNRGGLIVPYGKIRGFVPASQITGISRRMDPATLQARLAEMVGQTLPLKVMEVDRQNRRLIFSERTARREWRTKQREKLLTELQEGDHVHGVVSNICDFGVFVDLGGTDGLVHISELSWRRTNHPSEVVQVGEEVEAYVLRVDRENRRIGLSLRLMEPDPWEEAPETYAVGELVTGRITKLVAFGAFAALEDGIEGLIHISELAEMAPKHPSEVVDVGQELPLRIVKIDAQRRRMGLSLRRVTAEEWADWEEEHRAEEPEEEAEEQMEPEDEEALLGEELLLPTETAEEPPVPPETMEELPVLPETAEEPPVPPEIMEELPVPPETAEEPPVPPEIMEEPPAPPETMGELPVSPLDETLEGETPAAENL